MVDYIISVDLGQSTDHSALSALHRVWWRPGQRPDPDSAKLWHEVPTLLKWDLHTAYPKIISEIEEIYWQFTDEISETADVRLVVDQGGPGRPVVDELRDRRLRPIGVTLTSADQPHERTDGTLTCPKRDICSALVVAAQMGSVKVAAESPHAEDFDKEVAAFGYKINRETQNMGYESLQSAVHDDLVVTVALGLWYSTQQLSTVFPSISTGGADVEDMDYDPFDKE